MISNEERRRIKKQAAAAYRQTVRGNGTAKRPYDPDRSSLDHERHTKWLDGVEEERIRHEGDDFEILGAPRTDYQSVYRKR